MPKKIDRDEVARLLGGGAQLVEVLPREEYEQDHLPGAISLPVGNLEDEAAEVLEADRPVIVYCWDVA